MSRFAQTMFTRLPKNSQAMAFLDKHIVALNIVTSVLVAAFVIGYIAQVNGSVATGYELRALEERIQTLSLENQKLEIESHRVQALDNVSRNTKMLGLVPANQPEYVSASAPSYALAE